MTALEDHDSRSEEHPEILRADEEASRFLEVRRQCLRPHKHGWWRNMPNPHAVGSQISDDEL